MEKQQIEGKLKKKFFCRFKPKKPPYTTVLYTVENLNFGHEGYQQICHFMLQKIKVLALHIIFFY